MIFKLHDMALFASASLVSAQSSSFLHRKTKQEQYSNPCHEFGTASKLNSLYYDTPPTDGCPGSGLPSFRCSGVIIHEAGRDAGVPVPAVPDPDVPNNAAGSFMDNFQGKFYPLEIPMNFSIGISTLASASCPIDILDGGEYPYFCPTPKAISSGHLSFTYLRSDIARPVSFLREWEETGIGSYSNNSMKKPLPLYSGDTGATGHIFLPEASNPDAVLPENAVSFWENRYGAAWPFDAVSDYRVNCGTGPSFLQLMAGIGGGPPIKSVPNEVIIQCPPDSPHWSKWALPPSWQNYCPESVFSSSDAYYSHIQELYELGYDAYDPNGTTGFTIYEMLYPQLQNLKAYDPNGTLSQKFGLWFDQHGVQSPILLGCGIPPEKFDDVFIPAEKVENWPKYRQIWAQKSMPNRTDYIMNEVVIKPWHGMGLNQLGAHIVLFATEGSEDKVLQHAAEFYEASRIGGGNPIRVPVVRLHPDNLFKDGDLRPDVFECATGTVKTSPTEVSAFLSSGDIPGFSNATGIIILAFAIVMVILATSI